MNPAVPYCIVLATAGVALIVQPSFLFKGAREKNEEKEKCRIRQENKRRPGRGGLCGACGSRGGREVLGAPEGRELDLLPRQLLQEPPVESPEGEGGPLATFSVSFFFCSSFFLRALPGAQAQ